VLAEEMSTDLAGSPASRLLRVWSVSDRKNELKDIA
jgi:hypothetical protein